MFIASYDRKSSFFFYKTQSDACGGDLLGTEVALYNCLFSIQLISDSFLLFTDLFFFNFR